jgi:hypothetical protein
MPRLFSTGQGPSTYPSGFSPEEKAVETETPTALQVKVWEETCHSLAHGIASSQSQLHGCDHISRVRTNGKRAAT